MKKILLMISCLFMLVGCSSQDYDYEGRYALLTKGENTSLVIVWEYPIEDLNFVKDNVDLSVFDEYIDESFTPSGEGVVLNSLLGNLGYNRKFLRIMPINIHPNDVNKVIRKNIKVFMDLECTDGNTYKIRLKYDKSIKE